HRTTTAAGVGVHKAEQPLRLRDPGSGHHQVAVALGDIDEPNRQCHQVSSVAVNVSAVTVYSPAALKVWSPVSATAPRNVPPVCADHTPRCVAGPPGVPANSSGVPAVATAPVAGSQLICCRAADTS